MKPQDWGAMTQRGNTIYVHVMDPDSGTIEIPGFSSRLKSATFFDDESEVTVKKTKDGMTLTVPPEKRKPIDTIIVLTLK